MLFLSEILVGIFAAHLLGFLQICECQMCGPGKPKCPNNLCCSTYGYCGNTNEHCITTCDSQFGNCHSSKESIGVPGNRCGPIYNNRYCPDELCCSTSGYCGDTEEHCITTCNSQYGRCHPFKVNASIGFPSTGNHCGVEKNNRYCPDGLCCSQHGFCERSYEHCEDGCQRYFGHCDEIANCSMPSNDYNIFPKIPIKQRTLSSKTKNFWYFFCKPGSILKVISQPQPNTCNQDDGTWPDSLLPKCDNNVVFKSTETLSEIVDGNLLTCRDFPKGIIQKISIENTYFMIRDIRITTHKTRLNVFTLSIVDIDRIHDNLTTHWEKTFNNTIEYGMAVVFFSNVTTPLMSNSKRSIRLKPLVDMRVCELEVSSFYSGTAENYIIWVAIATSSVIFFLLVILILLVVCFQNRSKNKPSAIEKEHHPNSKNEYSLTDHQRAPRPPGSGFGNPGHTSFNSNEDDGDYYEEIIYTSRDSQPPLHNNSASHLLGQHVYDEAISLGIVLNKPRFAPPSVPQFRTN